jgi:LysM repeat protein
MTSGDWRRYVAPGAFLAAVTIAVVLVHAGLHAGSSDGTAPPTPTTRVTTTTTTTAATTTTGRKKHRAAARRYWTVRAGDTFATISSETGVPQRTIERLNPNVKSTSLFIGERIRIK